MFYMIRGKIILLLDVQIKNRIAELTDDLNQSEYLIQKAEKEMSNLKQLKEDKKTELLQVKTRCQCSFQTIFNRSHFSYLAHNIRAI